MARDRIVPFYVHERGQDGLPNVMPSGHAPFQKKGVWQNRRSRGYGRRREGGGAPARMGRGAPVEGLPGGSLTVPSGPESAPGKEDTGDTKEDGEEARNKAYGQ